MLVQEFPFEVCEVSFVFCRSRYGCVSARETIAIDLQMSINSSSSSKYNFNFVMA